MVKVHSIIIITAVNSTLIPIIPLIHAAAAAAAASQIHSTVLIIIRNLSTEINIFIPIAKYSAYHFRIDFIFIRLVGVFTIISIIR